MAKKTKKPDKTKAQVLHAKKRAKERFGIDFNRLKRIAMVKMIQNKESKIIEVTSNRVTVHELTFEGKVVHVVYDKIRKNIVTFLLPEWKVY